MPAEQDEDAPVRGADPVNDGEFEIGYDAAFEARWIHAELVCRLLMVAFVAAALGGLLGHGPFSHATTHVAAGMPSVDYESVARYGTPTTVTFHVANMAPESQRMTISMDFKVVQPLGLQRENPRPVSSAARQGGLSMTFDVPAKQSDALIQLVARPSTVGLIHLSAHVGDSDLSWDQFIVP
jgi:hypothetical protein